MLDAKPSFLDQLKQRHIFLPCRCDVCRDVVAVAMLSQVTGLPAAFIRKQPKECGTCRYAEGADLTGKRFVLVEDVVSSGGAIIDFPARLRADGCIPDAAIWVVDRLTGGREALAAQRFPLHALFTLDQIERA